MAVAIPARSQEGIIPILQASEVCEPTTGMLGEQLLQVCGGRPVGLCLTTYDEISPCTALPMWVILHAWWAVIALSDNCGGGGNCSSFNAKNLSFLHNHSNYLHLGEFIVVVSN